MGAWPGYPVSLYTPKECLKVFILRKSETWNRKGIPDVPRRHLNRPIIDFTTLRPRSWPPVIAALYCLTWSIKTTDKSFTIQTHGNSHETRPVLDCTRIRVSQTHLVLLARTLKGSNGTQFVDRHVQIGLRMRATRTGPVYRQIDKDRPSHDLSNNTYMYIVLLNTYFQNTLHL